jgi:hypothetical protein
VSTSTPALAALAVFAVLASCNSREVVAIDQEQDVVALSSFPLDDNRDVDILFVVDNSNSMAAEQAEIAGRFRALIDELERDGQLPSVHIGVVSTDVGGPDGGACTSGVDGAGQLLPSGVSCAGPNDGSLFLFDRVDDDGVRTKNYDGDLRDAFACMAEQGTGGCGFEQPLEAVRLALEHPANQGFVRDHAYLAIIFVTDEDDCSVTGPGELLIEDGDRTPAVLGSALGPFSSFRCFELGVECDGPGDPRAPGLRQDCVPATGSPYLEDVSTFVDAVLGAKEFPNQVLVAAIAGELEPVEVEMRLPENSYDFEIPLLAYSCTSALGEAVPPIRLASFLDSFPLGSRLASICNDDLSGAVDQVVELIREVFGFPCLRGDPAEPLECSVVEVTAAGTDFESERVLRECDNPADPRSSSRLPCYLMTPNPIDCPDTPTGLEVAVYYAEGFEVPPGTRAEVSCVGR